MAHLEDKSARSAGIGWDQIIDISERSDISELSIIRYTDYADLF